MGPLDSLNHLLNFFAPGFFVAVLTALGARLFLQRRPARAGLLAQIAISFLAAALVLAGGLWFFGHDGKIATYAALVLACATVQALRLGGSARR